MFLLEEIIFSDDKDHKIFCAICNAVGYNDDVVDYLLTLLDDYSRTMEFIKWAITDEIEKSVEPGTLFRSNTIATKFNLIISNVMAKNTFGTHSKLK